MLLYKAVLLTTFGRNSPHPFRAAIYRLSTLCVIAIGVSLLVSRVANDLPVTASATGTHLTYTAALVVQLSVLFVLLASLGITRSTNSDSLARLLLVLPVSRTLRWTALLLPSFILTAVTAILVGWPLAILLSKAGLHPLLFTAGSIAGVFAALGALHGIPRHLYWTQIVGIPSLLWAEYMLVAAVNNPSSTIPTKAAASIMLSLLFGFCCLLFWRSRNHVAHDISRSTPGRNVSGSSLPVGWWFMKKVVRAKTTRLGFVTAFCVSLVSALFLSRNSIDPYAFAFLASILAATFVSDIRSLATHSNPAEITGLRATTRFVTVHATTAAIGGLAAVSPLVATGIFVSDSAGGELAVFAVQLFFGINAGIFAGTLVVPVRRDITGQFAATLLCAGILVIVPYLPVVGSSDDAGLRFYQLSLAAILFAGTWGIEYQRNRYKWRKKSWKNQ
jgi:hypothetical protein